MASSGREREKPGKTHFTLLTWGALEAVMPQRPEPGQEFWLQGKVKVLNTQTPAKDPSARRVTLLLDEIVIDSYEGDPDGSPDSPLGSA